MRYKLLTLVAFFLTASTAEAGVSQLSAQSAGSKSPVTSERLSVLAKKVTVNMKDRSLRSVLAEIDRQVGGLGLSYAPATVPLERVTTLIVTNVTAREALASALAGTSLRIEEGPQGQVLLLQSQGNATARQVTGTVRGIVTDSATRQPLSGVNVSVMGTKLSAVTDKAGTFSIAGVSPGSNSVNARIPGYQPKTLTITVSSDRITAVDIRLGQSTTTLSEVVTTVTGVQRRVEVATDIVKIDADKVRERAPVRNVVDLIEAAQVPGIVIARGGGDPGSPSRIRIRGLGSISQSNDPVMIIDGVWIDATVSRPSRFDDLDPASIETIEIVRGPSAATLYGQDAANGVIVVTTKKGQAGSTRWNFSYNRDWGQTYGRHPLFYAGIGSSPRMVDPIPCSIERVLTYICTQDSVQVYDPNNPLVSREGVESNNKFSAQLDGGSNNVTYAVTLSTGKTIGVRRMADVDAIRLRRFGYNTTSDFRKPSVLNRNNLTTAFTVLPRSDVSLGITLTGSQANLRDNIINTNWKGIYGLVPPEFNPDTLLRSGRDGTIQPIERPLKTNSATVASTIQYRPRELGVISGNAGVEKINRTESMFKSETNCSLSSGCNDLSGEREETAENKSVYTMRFNASTALRLGKIGRFLDVTPSIGGDYKKTDQYLVSVYKTEIPAGDRSLTAGTLSQAANTTVQNATAGWFINSTIGLFKRVYFDVGVRQDIGSAITSSRNAAYPKIGGSWLISDEPFWRENSFVNSLRFRSAIGHAAVQPNPSDIDGRYIQGMQYVDGRFVKTSELSGVGNSKLQPERSVEAELGFDADMINDRLNLVVTYANKVNRNTLVIRTTPPSFGTLNYSNRKENVARVKNTNFELSAVARAIETSSTLLLLNYSMTLSDNKVVTLGNGISPFTEGTGRIAAGYPLAAVWSREVLGYHDDDMNGMLSASEIILSDSVVYLGWSQPRYRASYGISLTLLKQLTFDTRASQQSRYMQNYSQGYGPGAEDVNAPLATQAGSVVRGINRQSPISDFKWNSASVTYHLSGNALKMLRGRSASISLQGSNLGVWSNYVGRDPSINSGILDGEISIDNGLTPPRPRLYVIDIKIGY